MPRFEIVNADTPDAEEVEKPVQFRLTRDDGDVWLQARQSAGWVSLLSPTTTTGRGHLDWNDDKQASLPGLAFTNDGKWDVR